MTRQKLLHLISDPWARGGWMVHPAGWHDTRTEALLSRPNQRVLMAGSDIAPEFAGWIAGAMTSGRQAAMKASQLLTQA